jgi:hypothetical protein
MVSTSALISAVPDVKDRGAFISINASVQQLSGGLASGIAGLVVVQTSSGRLEHYDLLGYIVATAMLITIGLMPQSLATFSGARSSRPHPSASRRRNLCQKCGHHLGESASTSLRIGD